MTGKRGHVCSSADLYRGFKRQPLGQWKQSIKRKGVNLCGVLGLLTFAIV